MSPVIFLQGAVTMGCALTSLLFARYWHHSRDALFLSFSISFALLACSYVLAASLGQDSDWRVYVFFVRLLAYGGIVVAIVHKNRPAKR